MVFSLQNSSPKGIQVPWTFFQISHLTKAPTISPHMAFLNPFYVFSFANPLCWPTHIMKSQTLILLLHASPTQWTVRLLSFKQHVTPWLLKGITGVTKMMTMINLDILGNETVLLSFVHLETLIWWSKIFHVPIRKANNQNDKISHYFNPPPNQKKKNFQLIIVTLGYTQTW